MRGNSTLPRAVGDDRDEIVVEYGAGGPTPSKQAILTGNGGNPFTESGWTGWTDLDNGTRLELETPAEANSLGPMLPDRSPDLHDRRNRTWRRRRTAGLQQRIRLRVHSG